MRFLIFNQNMENQKKEENKNLRQTIIIWVFVVFIISLSIIAAIPTTKDNCSAPNTWNAITQTCEPKDYCPNVAGVQAEGTTCIDTLCLTTNIWNIGTQTCDESTKPIIDSALKDPILDSNFTCPKNYQSDPQNDALRIFITDYMKKFPEATISDMLTYRYSLLVKNNCKEALDYIKNQANGDDPLNHYIKKTLQDMNQTFPISNESIVKEKTTADIVTEWTSRVVFVICKWTDPNTGKLLEAGRGSGTLNYFSDNGYNIITNRHVVTNEQGFGANECTTLFPWDKDFTVSSNGIGRGITEDYGFIKLPDDAFLSKFPKESFKTCPLNSISIGDKLVILGFPAIGAESTITATEGIISGIDQNYFITSAKIDQGNSGGAAILIKDDCYLGIPSASMVGEIESLGRILKWNFAIN